MIDIERLRITPEQARVMDATHRGRESDHELAVRLDRLELDHQRLVGNFRALRTAIKHYLRGK